MLKKEFEELTGLYPSDNMYSIIEENYATYKNMSKERFCKMYKNNENGIAELIQAKCNVVNFEREHDEKSQLRDQILALNRELSMLEKQLKEVAEKYELEQEWKPYYNKCLLPKRTYEAMKEKYHKKLDTFEAKTFIHNTFGSQKWKLIDIKKSERFKTI